MHVRLLGCSVLAATLLLNAEPLAIPAAAQELQQCSIEGQPCGTPQQLYERIQHCLQDPNLCRDVRITRAGGSPGDVSAHPAQGPSGGPSGPAPTSASLPSKRVIPTRAVKR